MRAPGTVGPLRVDDDGYFALVDPIMFVPFIESAAGVRDLAPRLARERGLEHGVVVFLGRQFAGYPLSPPIGNLRPMRSFAHTVVVTDRELVAPSYLTIAAQSGHAAQPIDGPEVPRLKRDNGRYLVTVSQFAHAPYLTLAVVPALQPYADPSVPPTALPWLP